MLLWGLEIETRVEFSSDSLEGVMERKTETVPAKGPSGLSEAGQVKLKGSGNPSMLLEVAEAEAPVLFAVALEWAGWTTRTDADDVSMIRTISAERNVRLSGILSDQEEMEKNRRIREQTDFCQTWNLPLSGSPIPSPLDSFPITKSLSRL